MQKRVTSRRSEKRLRVVLLVVLIKLTVSEYVSDWVADQYASARYDQDIQNATGTDQVRSNNPGANRDN